MKMELFSKVTLLLGLVGPSSPYFYLQFEGSPKVSKMAFGPSLTL